MTMAQSSKILLGLLGGVLLGGAARLSGADSFISFVTSLEPIGTGFISLITMVVIPLVVASLTVATASVGGGRSLAGIGARTLAYFLVTTGVAVVIGVGLALILQPGTGLDPATRDALALEFGGDVAAVAPAAAAERGLLDVLVDGLWV